MKKIIGILVIASLILCYIPVASAIHDGIDQTIENVEVEDLTDLFKRDPSEDDEEDYPSSGTFSKCKIEASGFVSKEDWFALIRMPNMWKTFWFRFQNKEQTEQAFVSFWRIIFRSDAEITIYDEDNGDIIWKHQDPEKPQLLIFGYIGLYTNDGSTDDYLKVTIDGEALIVNTHLIIK